MMAVAILVRRQAQTRWSHQNVMSGTGLRCGFSSNSSNEGSGNFLSFFSFFSHNSERNWKRRRRQKARSKIKHNVHIDDVADEVDTRTVRDILFPNPYKDMKLPVKPFPWPKTFAAWRTALILTFRLYRSTWKGFFSSRGIFVDVDADEKGKDNQSTQLAELAQVKKEEVTKNVRRNMEFVKKEALTLREQVQEQTGIRSMEDLKRIAAELMRLLSDCAKEFMVGYRKGRDDEVEKMLTTYFQELQESVNKPQRRKKKRRILQP